MDMERFTPKPSLERVARAAGLNFSHFVRKERMTGNVINCFFVREHAEALMGVYSEDRMALRDFLINYRVASACRSVTLPEFAGIRGFKVRKLVTEEDDAKDQVTLQAMV